MNKTEEQLKAEAAAKEAADKARKEKEAKEAKAKADAEAKKLEEALAKTTAAHNTVTAAANEGATAFGTITDASSPDQVTEVGKTLTDKVKVVKDGIKLIKAEQRKFKDHGAIQDQLADSEKALAYLEGLSGGIKDRVKVAKDAAKAAADKEKADKKEADKKAKEEAKAKAEAEKEAKKEPEQNGVRKPSTGTLCRAVWDLCYAVSVKLGQPAPISFILQIGIDMDLNEANIKAEYARWKKYEGIEGRVAIPVPADVVEAAKAVVIPGTKEV